MFESIMQVAFWSTVVFGTALFATTSAALLVHWKPNTARRTVWTPASRTADAAPAQHCPTAS